MTVASASLVSLTARKRCSVNRDTRASIAIVWYARIVWALKVVTATERATALPTVRVT